MITTQPCQCPYCRARDFLTDVCQNPGNAMYRVWRAFNTPLPYTCFPLDRNGAVPKPEVPPVPVYVVSSWFLRLSFDYLTAQPEESLHYVTAVESNGHFYLFHLMRFELQRQSIGEAAGELMATHRAAVEADHYGHCICGIFHSHPGSGPEATRPSATDHETHEAFERGGYPVIGCIFARDGCLRFFSHKRPFAIKVFGTRITEISENVYKVDLDEEPPVHALEAGGSGRGGCNCPA